MIAHLRPARFSVFLFFFSFSLPLLRALPPALRVRVPVVVVVVIVVTTQQRRGVQPPVAQVVLGVVEYLPRLRRLRVGGPHVAGHHGAVVEQLQQAQAVARQDDLLLGALDRRQELERVRLLELLPRL